MNKKIIALALSLLLGCSTMGACGDTTSNKMEVVCENEDGTVDAKLSAKNLKYLGRTCKDQSGALWLTQSASGCEFNFTGKSLSVTILGDSNAASSWSDGNYARFAVYVDDERVLDELVNVAEKTYEILSLTEEETHTIRIIKLSEAGNSIMAIKSITVDGEITPCEDKAKYIEFIGDSITCGYGVDDEDRNHHFSTATEDATKTYAYKTAQALDADYSFVSYSGHGIISGYSGNGQKVTTQLVPEFYPYIAHTGGTINGASPNEVSWDFTKRTPDYIVINLGTNDASYTKGDSEKVNEYRDEYVNFIKTIRENNPESYIICTLGIMGNDLFPAIDEAVNMYKTETGDEKVASMEFDVQSPDDGYAADWHPTETTHAKAAEKLVNMINSINA